MFKTEMDFLQESIAKPLKNNLSSVMFWLGIFFVFIGAIFGEKIDSYKYIPEGTGEAILKGGSAILGAGVFAVIMKSGQFTNLFQKHIYDVFYDPTKVKDSVPIIVKWRIITKALLKFVLPEAHKEAIDLIEKQFFNSELEYHFEEYVISYQVAIDNESKIATIKVITDSNIVLSPNVKNPVLEQSVETDGNFNLLALRLNGLDCKKSDLVSNDPNTPTVYTLKLPLAEYVSNSVANDRVVSFERVVEWTQDLKVDPYIKVMIHRYIKGAKVRVKVPATHKAYYERFGLGMLEDENYICDDGEGYERWQLAASGSLLLPGQGFIIFVTPKFTG